MVTIATIIRENDFGFRSYAVTPGLDSRPWSILIVTGTALRMLNPTSIKDIRSRCGFTERPPNVVERTAPHNQL